MNQKQVFFFFFGLWSLSSNGSNFLFFCRVLLASSVLNLAELVALRPDLGRLRKVLYFHENQLIYPVRKSQERDFQYGYNQVLSWYKDIYCLAPLFFVNDN